MEIQKRSAEDGRAFYDMMQEFPAEENGLMNPIRDKSYEEYQAWLKQSVWESEQTELMDGWKVPSTGFWLLENGIPAGFGSVRHFLTDALRQNGGHVGYGIRPKCRNRGLGKKFLALLLEESRKTGLERVLLTVQNQNIPSIRAALANGGRIEKVSESKHYIWLET